MKPNEIIEQIEKAQNYIKKKKIEEASKILDELLKNIEPIEIDEHGKIMDFNTQLEFVIYCNMEKHSKISWKRNYLSEIYHLKGMIEFENGNFNEVISWEEKSLRWNPVNYIAYSEILEACIRLKDYKKFDAYFEKALKIIANPIYLAQLYKKMGFVCIDKGQDEMAYNLLLYSKLFFPRMEADKEISFLEKKVGTKLKYFPDLGVIRYIQENGLEYKCPEYIPDSLMSLIKFMTKILEERKYQTKESYLNAIDYCHSLYFHRPSESLHNLMFSFQKEYEEKFPIKKEEN